MASVGLRLVRLDPCALCILISRVALANASVWCKNRNSYRVARGVPGFAPALRGSGVVLGSQAASTLVDE